MVLAQVQVALLVPVGRFVLELKKPATILSNTFIAHRQYTDNNRKEQAPSSSKTTTSKNSKNPNNEKIH